MLFYHPPFQQGGFWGINRRNARISLGASEGGINKEKRQNSIYFSHFYKVIMIKPSISVFRLPLIQANVLPLDYIARRMLLLSQGVGQI